MSWKYLALKIAALISFLSFALLPLINGATGNDASLAYVFSVPSLAVLLLPRRFLNLARGIALGQSALLCNGALLVFAFSLFTPPSAEPEKTIVPVFVGFVMQLVFGVAALWVDDLRKKTKNELLAVGGGALASFLMLSLSFQRALTNNSSLNPQFVYRAIACEESYKADHGGQYARSLADMVNARGVSCVDGLSQLGGSKYGKIKYQALLASDGRVTGYSLIYGGSTFWGRFTPKWTTDQTGILHFSQNLQAPTLPLPVQPNITPFLHEWSQCLAKYAQAHSDARFPAKLESMTALDWSCKPTWPVKDNYLEPSPFYRVEYFSDAPDSTRPQGGFHLLGRPNIYGASGVRHYYVDESGIIRGTPARREAARDDPPIPECEWDERKACSPN